VSIPSPREAAGPDGQPGQPAQTAPPKLLSRGRIAGGVPGGAQQTNPPDPPQPPNWSGAPERSIRLAQPIPRLTLVVDAGDPVTPDLDRTLTALARRARDGDRDARDALYRALGPKIDRFVARYRWAARAAGGPERNGAPWDLDDVAQEAFPAFVDLLADYGGERAFLPYFLAAFPWRLRDAWHRLQAPARRVAAALPSDDLREDPSAVAEEARVLLATLAADLAEPDATILRLRVGEGISLPAIALHLGLSRTTVARRWERLRAWLRDQLADEVASVSGGDPSQRRSAPAPPVAPPRE